MNGATSRKLPYNYSDAGFDGFFRRTISGGADQPQTLRESSAGMNGNNMRFDDQQISGNLGDKIVAGTVTIDGKTGRIYIVDDQGNEVVRLGRVDG